MNTTRYVTTRTVGNYGPGLVIDIITITAHGSPEPDARDAHVYFGVRDGDGQWLKVRHRNGTLLGMVRDLDSLARHLGITPADIRPVAPRFWPSEEWAARQAERERKARAKSSKGGRAA
jgi:hypothetical protein